MKNPGFAVYCEKQGRPHVQVKSSQVKSSVDRLLHSRHCRFAGLCLYWVLKGFYFLLIWPYFEAFSGLFEDFGKWLEGRMQRWRTEGFTLVEMSMVLVIIGLLVGGVLVGQIMIKQAETQAQITQIQKYDSAVNTFKNKYNGIPGDLDVVDATNFGFNTIACNGSQGERDGNGLIDGYPGYPLLQGVGETSLFWQDLSMADFIDFPIGGERCNGVSIAATTTPGPTYIGNFFPAGKIGYGSFIYVYETGINWFGLSAITSTLANGGMFSNPTIPVAQAYNIDKKIDDGMPTSGNVQAVYLTAWVVTNAPNGNPDTSSTCYNNSTNTYSTNVSNGSNPNCALSFKMQGAAR